MADGSSTVGGLGFPTVLFLIFLVLKLTGNITWSWVWVTAPLWISWSVFVLIMVAFVFIAAKLN